MNLYRKQVDFIKLRLYNNTMTFLLNIIPWFWVAVLVICLAIESITSSLTTIWFALSAFIMIFLSLLPIPLFVQGIIFTLFSLVFLFFTRPLVIKKFRTKSATNSDRFIGMKIIIDKELSLQQKSTTKIYGVTWTVKLTQNKDIIVPANSECIIKEIEGNTFIVEPVSQQ